MIAKIIKDEQQDTRLTDSRITPNKLYLLRNNVSLGNFNGSSEKSINITVPTADSDLINDKYVRYDTNNQGLTSVQKNNVCANINAVTSSWGSYYNNKNLYIDNTGNVSAEEKEYKYVNTYTFNSGVNILKFQLCNASEFKNYQWRIEIVLLGILQFLTHKLWQIGNGWDAINQIGIMEFLLVIIIKKIILKYILQEETFLLGDILILGKTLT